jgi:hypothetical protein
MGVRVEPTVEFVIRCVASILGVFRVAVRYRRPNYATRIVLGGVPSVYACITTSIGHLSRYLIEAY